MKKAYFLAICLFLLGYFLLLAPPINLVTADLGRHLKNGQLIMAGDWDLLRANYYSYTYPDYSFLNHHWGSGLIFYLVLKLFGFEGLSIFFGLLSLGAFWCFFRVAQEGSGKSLALLASMVSLPLLINRREIRPEAFSYLFLGLIFWLLWRWQKDRIGSKWLYLIPVIQLLWINLHVYFFLGFLLSGVFLLITLTGQSARKRAFQLVKVGLLSAIASLINPAGIKGVIYPLFIFRDYGYRLFENQSVIFLDRIVDYFPNLIFKIVFALLAASWLAIFVKRKKFSLSILILSAFFSALAWWAVRNFTLFALFATPTLAINLKIILEERLKKVPKEMELFGALSVGLLIVFLYFILNSSYWLDRFSMGWGLARGSDQSASFFLENNLPGPVFNNYDIGGYLIYYLYPSQKVFVDNRPEAYPASFFQKEYIPAQENNDSWHKLEEKHRFQSIFFYRHDLTPWAQTFLLNRIKDPAWAPVYVDDWAIIFVKRNEENSEKIKKLELSKEMFSTNR